MEDIDKILKKGRKSKAEIQKQDIDADAIILKRFAKKIREYIAEVKPPIANEPVHSFEAQDFSGVLVFSESLRDWLEKNGFNLLIMQKMEVFCVSELVPFTDRWQSFKKSVPEIGAMMHVSEGGCYRFHDRNSEEKNNVINACLAVNLTELSRKTGIDVNKPVTGLEK